MQVTVRELRPDDSLDDLTELLHRAFRELAEQGWNVTAATQSVEVTRRRLSHGVGFVAEFDDHMVGTALLVISPEPGGPPCFFEPGVAVLGQFAVDPSCRGMGIGDALVAKTETEARSLGLTVLALDTPEPAIHLVGYYQKRGFRNVAVHQWPGKTYQSAVMTKTL